MILNKISASTVVLLLIGSVLSTFAQTPDMKPLLLTGEVTAISVTEKTISLSSNKSIILITFTNESVFKRVPPENPKLSAATASNVSEIGVGDKVLVSGFYSNDKPSFAARSVYLMNKSEIAAKAEREREAWRTRGISGKISALNPQTQDITVSIRGFAGAREVVIKPKEKVIYRRYAQDSVKYDDAKLSSFTELKIGDQLRALGDRSADGEIFSAEQILSGSFKMVGGTITAIDLAKKEITVKDIETNKPATIIVIDSTVLKKFPPEVAQMMAMRMMGGDAQGPAVGAAGVRPPGQAPKAIPNGVAPSNGGVRAGRGDFDDMVNNFPSLTISDLKVGDAIAISTSVGIVNNRFTAFKLLSGVDAFFKAQQSSVAGQGTARGVSGGFTIPGLDSIGFP
jgi:hypothetical protein